MVKIRCFVIDGKVVASIQREAMPGEEPISILAEQPRIKATIEEKRIAIKAAKAMDLKWLELILFVLLKAL
jgi:ribosomal protein S6--L-glutamate ligase